MRERGTRNKHWCWGERNLPPPPATPNKSRPHLATQQRKKGLKGLQGGREEPAAGAGRREVPPPATPPAAPRESRGAPDADASKAANPEGPEHVPAGG